MKLNKLELLIIDSLKESLSNVEVVIIDNQIKRFTKVQRDIYGEETLFYWKKLFNRVVPPCDYPMKFPALDRQIEFAQVFLTLNNQHIKASLYLIDGVFISINYSPSIKEYYRNINKVNITFSKVVLLNENKYRETDR